MYAQENKTEVSDLLLKLILGGRNVKSKYLKSQ